ncbi:hypothetical protein CN587_18475 [Bacillus wiedmannii]|uniref:hypothetical protein n=1 Tax=Bacillus wiedmannii TaxID=1890302 RepID=UPI000BEF1AF9|nr:hypothetical protein [Bacillus wiedmannii]PEO16413.1 hypothetical protein CN562_05670 [Bacillus wiedmannii]PEQ03305.1 hypothetical protein CN587_18475 [Bacillus wiedmannii]PFX61614.1 hypothetical protein COL36_10415 [Bacillus wiedmannii]
MKLAIMNYKDRILNDFNGKGHEWEEFCRYLNMLLDETNIDNPLARELAQQILIHPDKLTSQQWEYFYMNGLGEHYYVATCAVSGHEMEWQDMDFAHDNGDECEDCINSQNE